MTRGQTGIGRILISALVVLLLCGIVAGEFPELLTLTDNTTNDFTVVKSKSAASSLQVVAGSQRYVAYSNTSIAAFGWFSTRLDRFEHSALIPTDRCTLHCVLRT
ncbi:MAG: hypothetical protein WA823_08260 [Candidatus Acidiferrales bacterium]